MLEGLLFFLSPARRRFMRELGRPAMARLRERSARLGAAWASGFVTTLLSANAEFLAFALSKSGPMAQYAAVATPINVEACFGSMLIYAASLFAREEFAKNESELIPFLACVLERDNTAVMIKRDALRKTPRSEEWMLYTWLVKDLGAPLPTYDARLERNFGYQYLSYIGQYQGVVERFLKQASH